MNKFPRFVLITLAAWLLAGCALTAKSTPTPLPSLMERQGGLRLIFEPDLPADMAVSPADMDALKTVLSHRLESLGVAEASVTRQGERQIVVDLPGVQPPAAVLSTLTQTGLLELVDFSTLDPSQASQLVGTSIATDFKAMQNPTAVDYIYHTVLSGASVTSAKVTQGTNGQPQVFFQLTEDGKALFADYTASHIGQVLAIVVDKVVVSAPTIQTAITGGEGVIVGKFSQAEALSLAAALNSGALPFPLRIVETKTVPPTGG